MKQKVIIRADGGTSIGMGHVIRCIALADMLKNNFTITFAIQKPTDSVIKSIHLATETIVHLPVTDNYNQDAINFSQFLEPTDIVVLDGYHFQTDYQKTIKSKGCKLVVIDDLHSWHHVADAIINHAAGITESVYSKEEYTKLYLGLEYALLRKPFLIPSKEIKRIDSIKEVFISMGAADITNLTQKFTEALVQVEGIEKIHLMLGSINPNLSSIDKLIETSKNVEIVKHFDISAEQLAALLKTCDVSICPASSISLESCAIGIGLISGYTAGNQKGNLVGMAKRKILLNFGNLSLLTIQVIQYKIITLIKEPETINEMIKNQRKMIDNKSPERILSIFNQL